MFINRLIWAISMLKIPMIPLCNECLCYGEMYPPAALLDAHITSVAAAALLPLNPHHPICTLCWQVFLILHSLEFR